MTKPVDSARNSVEAQERLFRLAERDFGLSLKVLSIDTGIPPSTLKGWKDGATMPAWALGALGRAGVPDYLLSLVLHPFSRHVGTDDTGEGALEDLAREAVGFGSEFLDATSPNSPGGPRVVPMEGAKLAERALRVEAAARRVRA